MLPDLDFVKFYTEYQPYKIETKFSEYFRNLCKRLDQKVSVLLLW